MTIGEKIKYLRVRNGLSQEALAITLNTTKQAIYKYENNIVTNIPMDKVAVMASVLNTTPAYLMGWDDPVIPVVEKTELTPNEQLLLDLFRQIPEEQQRVFLEMGRVYANSLKKG